MKGYLSTNLIRAFRFALFYSSIFLYTIVFNNPTGWALFFFLTFLLLADLILLAPSLKKIQVHSSEHTLYEVNRQHKLKLEIFRYRPTLLRIPMLTITLAENVSVQKQVLPLYSGQSKQLVFDWKPTKRGVFEQLPLVLVGSDVFQLFSKKKTLFVTGPFVILPMLQLDLAEQVYQHLLAASPNFTAPFGDQTFTVRNFRKYNTGDPLNSVDWKQSGKRNELIIKEFEHETKTNTHFLFYGLPDEKFEELLSLYYSLIHLVEKRLSFEETILATMPDSTSKEIQLALMTPLRKECPLPTFSNKKLVIFAPKKTEYLDMQLTSLQKKNDIFLFTFEDEMICLHWKDQVTVIKKGGPILEK